MFDFEMADLVTEHADERTAEKKAREERAREKEMERQRYARINAAYDRKHSTVQIRDESVKDGNIVLVLLLIFLIMTFVVPLVSIGQGL